MSEKFISVHQSHTDKEGQQKGNTRQRDSWKTDNACTTSKGGWCKIKEGNVINHTWDNFRHQVQEWVGTVPVPEGGTYRYFVMLVELKRIRKENRLNSTEFRDKIIKFTGEEQESLVGEGVRRDTDKVYIQIRAYIRK